MGDTSRYVLGSDDAEVARLDAQSAMIGPASAMHLRAAGIRDGMRVLDLGTGLGHVAFQIAELVGPGGAVVGVDLSETLLATAERRRLDAGYENVRFVEADARSFRDAQPFDAVVARLLLFHLPDPVGLVRTHCDALADGGTWLTLDFDLGSCRSFPPVPLVAQALAWVEAAFVAAGADPRIGARLLDVLGDAGLREPTALGIQPYIAPDGPQGPAMLSGIVRALAPKIVEAGIATAAELELDTFESRVATELRLAGAVLLTPTLVGARARR